MESEASPRETRLTVVADELQASMVCSLLDSNGIACRHQRTAGAGVDWGLANVGMSGYREILVGEHQEQDARELLASLDGVDGVGSSEVLASSSAPAMTEAEEARQLAGMRRLRRGYALAVLLLFGVPVVLGLGFQLLTAARGLSG